MTKHDDVNNPAHYDLFPGQQAIDIIKAALTPEEFAGYLKGNALKYRLRAGQKGDADKCLAKANWYRDRLWAECAATGSFDESAIGDTGGEWPESRADIIGQNGNDGEHYSKESPDWSCAPDGATHWCGGKEYAEQWLKREGGTWSLWCREDGWLVMDESEQEAASKANADRELAQRPAYLTAKTQDDIPTIKRSALPSWVPADAEYVSENLLAAWKTNSSGRVVVIGANDDEWGLSECRDAASLRAKFSPVRIIEG